MAKIQILKIIFIVLIQFIVFIQIFVIQPDFTYIYFKMYPSLQDNRNSVQFRKTINPSDHITNAMLQLKNKFNISSFKPHLNYYECHLNLIVNNKMNIPIKIIFLRNYPKQAPIIYAQKWMQHPLIKIETCEIVYSDKYMWEKMGCLSDLLVKLQNQFTQMPPTEKSQVQMAIAQLQQYQRDVESLRNRPPGTQPPPPPNINFQNILKVFEYQQNLKSQCEQRNSTYIFTAQEYSQNVQRVKCISERFGKNKILKQMQNQLSSVLDQRGMSLDQVMKKFYQNRKKFHRVKILKEKYLENS